MSCGIFTRADAYSPDNCFCLHSYQGGESEAPIHMDRQQCTSTVLPPWGCFKPLPSVIILPEEPSTNVLQIITLFPYTDNAMLIAPNEQEAASFLDALEKHTCFRRR